METASITELLRDPKGVIRKLDRASEVIIERRDAAPLRLALSSRVEQDREGTGLLARIFEKALPENGQTRLGALRRRVPVAPVLA